MLSGFLLIRKKIVNKLVRFGLALNRQLRIFEDVPHFLSKVSSVVFLARFLIDLWPPIQQKNMNYSLEFLFFIFLLLNVPLFTLYFK